MDNKKKALLSEADVIGHDLDKLIDKVRNRSVKIEEQQKTKTEKLEEFTALGRLIAFHDTAWKLLNACKLVLGLV